MDYFADNVFFCDGDFPKSLTAQLDLIFVKSESSEAEWFDTIVCNRSLRKRIHVDIKPSGQPKYMELIDNKCETLIVQSSMRQNPKSESGPYDYEDTMKLGLRFRDERGAYCQPNVIEDIPVNISWRRMPITLKRKGALPEFQLMKSTSITVSAQTNPEALVLKHKLTMQHGDPAKLNLMLRKCSDGEMLGDGSGVRVREEFQLTIEVQDRHQENIRIKDECKIKITGFYFKDSCKHNEVESRQENFHAGEQHWDQVQEEEALIDEAEGVFTIKRCRFQGKAGDGRLCMKAQLTWRDSTKDEPREFDLKSELRLKLHPGDASRVDLKEPRITTGLKIIPLRREETDQKSFIVTVTDVAKNPVRWESDVKLSCPDLLAPTTRDFSRHERYDRNFSYIFKVGTTDFKPDRLQRGAQFEAEIFSRGKLPGASAGFQLDKERFSFVVEPSNRVEKICQEVSDSTTVLGSGNFKTKVTLVTEDEQPLPQSRHSACCFVLQNEQSDEIRFPLRQCKNVDCNGNTVSAEIPLQEDTTPGEYRLYCEYKESRRGLNVPSTLKSDPCKVTILPGPCLDLYMSYNLFCGEPGLTWILLCNAALSPWQVRSAE